MRIEECQSRTATREIFGSLIKYPQLIKEYPFEMGDFVELLYKILYSSIFNLAQNGAVKLDIPTIEAYLIENFPSKYNTYEKYNGRKYLEQAIILSNPENFKMYYEEIKKYSMLREYASAGIDISEFCPDEFADAQAKEDASLKLASLTLEQLGEYFKSKILKINNHFILKATRNSIKAGGEEAKLQKEMWKKGINYGLSYASNYLTCATDGIRRKRLTILSAGSGVGKSRMTIANICHTFAPEFWDSKKEKWVSNPNGTQNKVLYIETEMSIREEIEPIMEAYIADVPEDHILHPELYLPGEEERVDKAIDILTQGQIYIEYMPDYCLSTLEEVIATHVFDHGVTCVMFDYIHITAQLMGEYAREFGQEGREDQVLSHVGNKLKDWTAKYNISIDTWTQLNAEGIEGIRDQRAIRGSKALADKADICGILSIPTEHELKKINDYSRNVMLRGRLMCLSIYKNRGAKYKDIKIWLDVEYGTMRVHDLFVTDYNYALYEDITPVAVNFDEEHNVINHYNNYETMVRILQGGAMPEEGNTEEDFFDDGIDLNSISSEFYEYEEADEEQ